MIRVCVLLMMVLSVSITCHGQDLQVEAAKLETTYDAGKDRTTVRLTPVQLSGEIDKYHSLHMAPSFSFPGRQPERPSMIDFELQTIVKARLLDSDLYVLFNVDGEKTHLSSNRSAIFRPVPGRRWIGERLVFRMPYETFVKITKAKKLDITFDGVKFEVGALQLDALRLLASKMD
jgi:hypothetical protein